MTRHAPWLVLLSMVLLGGCAAPPPADGLLADPAESEEELTGDKADAVASTSTYYTIRRDYRRCVSPLCGGWWVARVNKATTRCADGHYATECYVAEVDISAHGLDAAGQTAWFEAAPHALLRGSVERHEYGSFGNLGVFAVTETWSAATEAEPDGYFYRVRDNGIRCITYPCYSLHEAKLNSSVDRDLSGVDLAGAGATDAQVEEGLAALATDGGLLAAGVNRRIRRAGPAGTAVVLEASQFYTRFRPPAPPAPRTCSVDSDCGLSLYTRPVGSAADCYCPLCPVPMHTAEAEGYAEAYVEYCSGLDWIRDCPIPSCARPPGVGCLADNTCGYVFGTE